MNKEGKAEIEGVDEETSLHNKDQSKPATDFFVAGRVPDATETGDAGKQDGKEEEIKESKSEFFFISEKKP